MTLLLDNGAYKIKLGTLEGDFKEYQNCIGKAKKDIVTAPSSLNGITEVIRPHERGVLVDPDLQSKIFKRIFNGYTCHEMNLVITCPIYTPKSCRKELDEIIFEEFDFKSSIRIPNGYQGTGILIDLGFSASTIIPYMNSNPINYAVKRVNVAGKLITNYLKEQISFRQYDMRDETWLVNTVKEKLCQVSCNFQSHLERIR